MYLNKFVGEAPSVVGPVVATSTGDIVYWASATSKQVKRLMFAVTTLFSTSTPAIINFYARPTHGSTTGQVLLGFLTIPTAAAVGKCYYKDIEPAQRVPAGWELVVNVGTAATSAGAGIPNFEADESPEVPLNQSNLVASL